MTSSAIKINYNYIFNQSVMESDTLIDRATICGQLIHQCNSCMVYKVTEKNTCFIVKAMKGKRVQDTCVLNTIIGQRTNPKDVTKVLQYTAKQGDKFISCRCPYYGSHYLLQYLNMYPMNKVQILQKIIELIFRGEPFYLYSYQNLFFNIHTLQVIFNPTSIVGLVSIGSGKNFPKKDFEQTYQLLDREIFEEGVQNRWDLITYKSKLRAIAMLILHIIIGSRVSLLKETDVLQDQINYQNAKKLLHKIPERFRSFLKGKDVVAKIKKAEDQNKANYLLFLRRVFQDNCAELEWKEAIMLLFLPFRQKTDEDLRQALEEISRRLFALQDEFSLKFLVRQGLAKKKLESIILLDQNLYLHYLLSAASFKFETVADQISQQKYMTQDNSSIFVQMIILIRKLIAEYDYQRQNRFGKVDFLNYVSQKISRKSMKTYFEDNGVSEKQSFDTATGCYFIEKNPQHESFHHYYSTLENGGFSQQSQPITQINHLAQPEKQSNLNLVVRAMAQKFKAHAAEISGSRILGLNNQMKMLNKFLNL